MKSITSKKNCLNSKWALIVEQVTSAILLNLLTLNQDFDEGVHSARKYIKSLRASIKLFSPVLGDEYHQSQHYLKHLAQLLSPFRDQFILLECWKKYASKDDRSRFHEFELLLAKQTLSTKKAKDQLLEQLPDQYLGLLIHSQAISAKLLENPLSRSWCKRRYNLLLKQAKKTSHQAQELTNNSVIRHEQRKRLKDLGYALDILSKKSKVEVKKEILSLKSITELLGDANDIELLLEAVQSQTLDQKKKLVQSLQRRQTDLWNQADEALSVFFKAFKISAIYFEFI